LQVIAKLALRPLTAGTNPAVLGSDARSFFLGHFPVSDDRSIGMGYGPYLSERRIIDDALPCNDFPFLSGLFSCPSFFTSSPNAIVLLNILVCFDAHLIVMMILLSLPPIESVGRDLFFPILIPLDRP